MRSMLYGIKKFLCLYNLDIYSHFLPYMFYTEMLNIKKNVHCKYSFSFECEIYVLPKTSCHMLMSVFHNNMITTKRYKYI